MVRLPATQIHQQVADRAGVRMAVGCLQSLAQWGRQGHAAVSAGPLFQHLQRVPLLLPKQLGIERLAGPQDLLPDTLLALLAVLAVAGLAQLAQVVEGPGADALLAQPEPELIALQPQPGSRQLGGSVAAARQIAPAGQIETIPRFVLEKQPGGGPFPGRRQGGRQLLWAEGPWQTPQPGRWIDTGRQGADQLDIAAGHKLGAGGRSDGKLQAVGLQAQDNSQT